MGVIDNLDVVVIGAGVIGLAVAREFALAGREVIVLESGAMVGMETSSRNSGVIHAGIYYPRESLKAQLCVSGKALLYKFCTERNIAHQRLGKLILATSQHQIDNLLAIKSQAHANGVTDLTFLSPQDIAAKEPAINAAGALFSPSTGIIDVHELMLALQGDLERAGGVVVFSTKVIDGRVGPESVCLRIADKTESEVSANLVVNAAGLHAVALARSLRGLPDQYIPPAYFAKGVYFNLQGRAPFEHLIYPLPEDGGLGIHLTLDLGGQVRFGPNVEWVDNIDYGVDDARKHEFVEAIRRYYPNVNPDQLQPAYAGIRPKIVGPGMESGDFIISLPEDHGIATLVNLFGIESPGLTASLAIAHYIAEKFDR